MLLSCQRGRELGFPLTCMRVSYISYRIMSCGESTRFMVRAPRLLKGERILADCARRCRLSIVFIKTVFRWIFFGFRCAVVFGFGVLHGREFGVNEMFSKTDSLFDCACCQDWERGDVCSGTDVIGIVSRNFCSHLYVSESKNTGCLLVWFCFSCFLWIF